MVAIWCAASIEKTRLRHENERPFGISAVNDFAFAGGNFLECSSEMERSRPATFLGPPWHRLRERIIDFENSWGMTKSLEALAISRGKLVCGNARKLPAGGVE